mmetsp:Transcript_64124/g.165039  ORF Transcript_64124/g.165039 Transcript_64124/m.165039 type:complete len:168 (-) Transcript_64124:131-634(-)
MKPFCALRCLSFLGGKRPPNEYEPVDGQGLGKPDDEEEDDFFAEDWGATSGPSVSSKETEAKSQGGVERNPTRETTTKRTASASPVATGPAPAPSVPQPKAGGGPKKEMDFFNELGMEPEYKAPRVLDPAKSSAGGAPTVSVGSLLDDDAGVEAGGGWGDDDLDLGS